MRYAQERRFFDAIFAEAALHAGGAPRRSRARAGGEAHDMRQDRPVLFSFGFGGARAGDTLRVVVKRGHASTALAAL